MAYCKFPPPSALKFDLNSARNMHSYIRRMYVQHPSSYCTVVGTYGLPNPKYQRYYDAERDYLVPYNSGDTPSNKGSESESNNSIDKDGLVPYDANYYKSMCKSDQSESKSSNSSDQSEEGENMKKTEKEIISINDSSDDDSQSAKSSSVSN